MKYVETPEYVRPPVAALTDKAGAGKTFVALSLVCKDIEEGRLGCTVVVVPKTIVMQWKSAIKIRTQHEVYDGHRLYVGIRANVWRH
jgi:SNF2 family DNA or RNA helicase